MVESVFNELAILLSLSVILGLIGIKLRQPLVLPFIIVGIIVGPRFLNWVVYQHEIEVLASFGVTLLLFAVGLKIDVHVIKTFGMVILLIGLAQIIVTALIGYLIGRAVGMQPLPALFMGLSLAFSSTIIIIKVLSDRFEIDSLYGRISVGILIVQDLVVVCAIIVLSALDFHDGPHAALPWQFVALLVKGSIFLAAVGLIMQFVFPRLLDQLALSRELLVLFAITWAIVLAVIARKLGYTQEVGGFLAGVSLASCRYREAIVSRLETLRNLMLLFFFLDLGASLKLTFLKTEMTIGILLSLFVLVGKPLIVMGIMGLLRFKKRTGFLTGMTMGQISEFSLILAALGLNLGYIDKSVLDMITLVGLITIGTSTYMMAYANYLYHFASPWLSMLERNVPCRETAQDHTINSNIDVIIYGLGRHGEHIAKSLAKHGLKVMGIDFDPRKMNSFKHSQIVVQYGDAEDGEFCKGLPLDTAKWVVSTIAHPIANQVLVSSLKELQYQGKVAVSAYQENDYKLMEQLGADLIFVPYRDAASLASERLLSCMR